MSIGQNVMIH